MKEKPNSNNNFVHSSAEVLTKHIGTGTRIWQQCNILPGARIGKNCNINCNVFIENDVVIGDNVTVKSGVQLWDGLNIEDDVFIGPNVTFTNDLFPRAGKRPDTFLQTTVKTGASIGANATIIGSRNIGRYALIGAGSVVTHDIPNHTLWYGNPARFKGYVCCCGYKLDNDLTCNKCGESLTFKLDALSNRQQNQNEMQTYTMDHKRKISESCTIHGNVKFGQNITICDDVIIYDNVKIGDDTFIGPQCILGEPLAEFYQQQNGYENPPLVIGRNSIIRSHNILYAGSKIGESLRTGHHVTIREHSIIGKHCSIGNYCDVQGNLQIGNYCRFHSYIEISQLTTIKDYVQIYPFVALTNDPHPPSETCRKGPVLEEYCVISAGAAVMPGLTIGRDSVVGIQSLVTKDVQSETVVLGVPARKIGSIHDIRCKEGKLEKPYPWRNHYSRGMPWESK